MSRKKEIKSGEGSHRQGQRKRSEKKSTSVMEKGFGCLFLIAIPFVIELLVYQVFPQEFHDVSLLSPLSLNLIFAVLLFWSILSDKDLGSLPERVCLIAVMLFWGNVVFFLFHVTIGVPGKRHPGLPPLWSEDLSKIWFPIVTYIFFLILWGSIYLGGRYWRRRK